MKKSILLSLILISGTFWGCNIPSMNTEINNEFGNDESIANETDNNVSMINKIVNEVKQETTTENSIKNDSNFKNLVDESMITKAVLESQKNNTIDSNSDNSSIETSNLTSPVEKLAKCLADNGVKMYGTKMCGYCLKQEEMFGENFKHINYINCMEQPEVCGVAGISGVPAWEFADGSKKSGLQSFEALASMAGCEYNF